MEGRYLRRFYPKGMGQVGLGRGGVAKICAKIFLKWNKNGKMSPLMRSERPLIGSHRPLMGSEASDKV